MDGQVIVFNIGNTSTKIALMGGLVKDFEWAVANDDPAYRFMVSKILDDVPKDVEIEKAVIVSVVPERTEMAIGAIRKSSIRNVVQVDPACPLWFGSAYKTMETLGADRLCAVIALRELYSWPAVAIDCGTALTFNVVDVNGDFAGGNILPGITTSFRSLNMRTAQLPDAQGEGVPPLLGESTVSAIQAGVMWTLWKGLDGMIEEVEKRTGQMRAVVVCGGDARFLLARENRRWVHDPDLVLRGAVLWAVDG
jgi:type III pantothenate kinase